MNWQSFIHLIQEESDNTIFIKDAENSSLIGKTICGFLNTMNGKLIIGYDKVSIHLTGYNETDQWIDQFIEEHFTNSQITSTFLFRSNKKILILDILKSTTKIPFLGSYYQIENKRAVELVVANEPQLYTPPPITPVILKETPVVKQQPIEQSNKFSTIETQTSTTKHFNDQSSQKVEQTSQLMFEASAPEIQQSIASLSDKSEEGNNFEYKLNETDNPNMIKRQQKALDFINKQGSIKNKQYRKLFNVSHKTAHIELADLVKQNKIEISGSGRSTCYVSINETISQKSTNELSQEKIHQIQLYITENNQLTAPIYADLFNIDLAQAIEELQSLSNLNIVNQINYNNQIFYTKPSNQPALAY